MTRSWANFKFQEKYFMWSEEGVLSQVNKSNAPDIPLRFLRSFPDTILKGWCPSAVGIHLTFPDISCPHSVSWPHILDINEEDCGDKTKHCDNSEISHDKCKPAASQKKRINSGPFCPCIYHHLGSSGASIFIILSSCFKSFNKPWSVIKLVGLTGEVWGLLPVNISVWGAAPVNGGPS